MMAMGIQCKTFDQSYKVLKDIKRRVEEFNKITKGELFEERNKAWLATAVIDSKTLDRMDARPDMEIEKRTFSTVMTFMDEHDIEYNSVQRFSRAKGDPMDVGALGTKLECDEDGYMVVNGARVYTEEELNAWLAIGN